MSDGDSSTTRADGDSDEATTTAASSDTDPGTTTGETVDDEDPVPYTITCDLSLWPVSEDLDLLPVASASTSYHDLLTLPDADDALGITWEGWYFGISVQTGAFEEGDRVVLAYPTMYHEDGPESASGLSLLPLDPTLFGEQDVWTVASLSVGIDDWIVIDDEAYFFWEYRCEVASGRR